MKKVLSLVLVIAMVLSSMSFAFAGTFADVKGDYEDAVNALAALGVVKGYEDGTYRPERAISRAELAKLLVEALGYGKLVAGAANTYSDTQGHWASGYVTIASGTGLVVGYPNGTFQPDKTVTYDEAFTMVLRALGYNDASLKGIWPTNYKVKAIDLGLDDDVVMATAAADRGGVAQILFNALDAFLVEVNADNIAEKIVKSVVTNDDGDKVTTYEILLDKLATETDPFQVIPENLDADDDDNYKGDKVDLAPYMYQTIIAYEVKDEVVFVKSVESLVFEGEIEVDGTTITIENPKDEDETFTFTADISGDDKTLVYLNGDEVYYGDITVSLNKSNATLVFAVDSDEDLEDGLELAGIVVDRPTEYALASEEYEDGLLMLEGIFELPVDDEEVDFDNLVVKGDAEELEEIEENDVLAFFYPGDDDTNPSSLEILVTRNAVEGKITRQSGTKFTVGGKAYEVAAVNEVEDGVLEVGNEVALYLNENGKIYAAETTDDVVADDYAIVLDPKDGAKIGTITVADPKVKLLTVNGEEVTYLFDKDLIDEGTVVTAAAANVLDVQLNKGDLVKYNVDKDGKIDEIEVVKAATAVETRTIRTTGNSFDLASNAVIFYLPNVNLNAETVDYKVVTDADVITKAELGDEAIGYTILDGVKIEVLVVYDIENAEDDTVYAVITGSDLVVDPDDEDELAYEYTAYVDGEEVTYVGEENGADLFVGIDGVLVELAFTDGRLSGAEEVDNETDVEKIEVVSGTAGSTRVSTVIKDADGDVLAYLTDDVVVYVYDADAETEFKVGSLYDIRNNDFTAYNLNLDDTNDFGIVIVDKTVK